MTLWWLLLWVALATAQPWPSGTWVTSPGDVVVYKGGQDQPLQLVSARTVTTGWAYATSQTYMTLNPPGHLLTANFSGSVGCTGDDVLVSVETSTCVQTGYPAPEFCQSAPQSFGGTFTYSVTKDFNGEPVLIVQNWGGTKWPYRMECAAGEVCSSTQGCNKTAIQENNIYINAEALTMNNITGGSTVVIQGNGTTIIQSDEVTIDQSTDVTIVQSSNSTTTTVNVEGSSNVTITPTTNTSYTITTGAPNSCGDWCDWKATLAGNFTVSTVGYNRVEFTAGGFEAPGDWNIQPDTFTLRYGGEGGFSYQFLLCFQYGKLYSPYLGGQRLLFSLVNVTASPVLVDTGAIASSVIATNTSNPIFTTGTCTSIVTGDVYTDNLFGVVARLEYTDGTSGTASLSALGISLTVIPVGCQGVDNSIEINLEFPNGTLLNVQCPMSTTFDPDDNSIDLEYDGVTYFTVNGGTLRGGVIDLIDSDSVTWEPVTNDPDTGCGGTTTWRANVPSELANVTECVTCNENGTMTIKNNVTVEGEVNAEKICSEEPQCEVRSDPPSDSPGPGPDGWVGVPCFACSDDGGHHGGGGGGSGGNGGGGPPPVIIIPPILAFFPPVVPVVVPPIATPANPGTVGDPPTSGGTFIPEIDMTNPPFCGNSTFGSVGLDKGTPSTEWKCQKVANGSYAWVPYCPCSNTDTNVTNFLTNSTQQLTCSTLYLDSCSQFINYGPTYLDTLYLNGTRILPGNGTACCEAPVTGVTQGSNIVVTGAIGTNQTVATSATPTFTTVTTTDLIVTGTTTGLPITGVTQGTNIVVTGATGTNQTIATSLTPTFTSVTATGDLIFGGRTQRTCADQGTNVVGSVPVSPLLTIVVPSAGSFSCGSIALSFSIGVDTWDGLATLELQFPTSIVATTLVLQAWIRLPSAGNLAMQSLVPVQTNCPPTLGVCYIQIYNTATTTVAPSGFWRVYWTLEQFTF